MKPYCRGSMTARGENGAVIGVRKVADDRSLDGPGDDTPARPRALSSHHGDGWVSEGHRGPPSSDLSARRPPPSVSRVARAASRSGAQRHLAAALDARFRGTMEASRSLECEGCVDDDS